jgi:outer membrane lipoprotein-sorting protein
MMEAGFNMRLTVLLLVLIIFVSGCAAEDAPFILPVNYSGEALMKVYTDKTENDYKVNIICRDGNYSIRTESENEAWNYAYVSGGRCILNNDKFPESSVTIENFKINETLIHDFDFRKFDVLEEIPEELIYWDGEYKHVLNFSKDNLLPRTIFIYNKDKLVKAIQYETIIIEE